MGIFYLNDIFRNKQPDLRNQRKCIKTEIIRTISAPAVTVKIDCKPEKLAIDTLIIFVIHLGMVV